MLMDPMDKFPNKSQHMWNKNIYQLFKIHTNVYASKYVNVNFNVYFKATFVKLSEKSGYHGYIFSNFTSERFSMDFSSRYYKHISQHKFIG